MGLKPWESGSRRSHKVSFQNTFFQNRPTFSGVVAQLVEHLLCKQGVIGSIPIGSTSRLRPAVFRGGRQPNSRDEDTSLRLRPQYAGFARSLTL